MDQTIAALLSGFARMLEPSMLLACFGGTLAGTLVGVLPGLGPSAAVAILLPVIYGADPLAAIVVLAGIYYGAMYGGTITSVLLNVPGESASVVTTFDGYPLAKAGKAGVALGLAAIGSFVAGTLGLVFLSLTAQPLASLAIAFGPAEYFAIMIFAFVMVSSLSGGSVLKGLLSLFVGLLLASVGQDIVSGQARLTMGQLWLMDGINFVPVVVGLFGLAELIDTILNPSEFHFGKQKKFSLRGVFPSRSEVKQTSGSMVRGSFLGFFIGVLPGAGATIASFLSYGIERRVSKTPELFGKGALQGVVGPESANNAASSGAFVPLLALGIPGSATAAVLISGFVILGMQPGPRMFVEHPDVVWGLIASMYVGNVMLLLQNTLMIPIIVWILAVSRKQLPIVVALFCVVGVYGVNNSLFDVWMMLGFGMLGYAFKHYNVPLTPLIIALVLGGGAEEAFRQALIISGGSPAVFFQSGIACAFLVISVLVLMMPSITRKLMPPTEQAS